MRFPRGLRWWELLPEAVLGIGLVVFVATETSVATSAFNSRTAVALMVLGGVGWLAGRALLVRYTHWPALRLAVFSLCALGVLSVVVLPAYDDTTVVETLDVGAAVTPTAPVPDPTTTTAAAVGPEALPSAPPTTTTTVGALPEPVVLRSGPVRGIDHRASGTAVLYRQSDRSLVIGLEDIDIQPGPDYDVYVVPGVERENIDGGTRLDDLRGNKGTQYYPTPAGLDLSTGDWTVLVWCQTFDVPVAGATPS